MTSLLFREHGQPEWREATTVNLSHTGVLFRTAAPVPAVGRAMEFIVALPLNGLTPVPKVRCTGQVVRIAGEDMAGGSHAVAVAIDGYSFESFHRA